MSCTIKHAIIPAGGKGTRMWPLTASYPKEMLPLFDKPLIHHAVDEAASSGINEIIIVTHPDKTKLIKNYFFSEDVKDMLLKSYGHLSFHFPEQRETLGLGHAIFLAKKYITSKYFSVILPDEYIDPSWSSTLSELMYVHNEIGGSVIAVDQIEGDAVSSYGVVTLKKSQYKYEEISSIIEKPKLNQAPSNFIIVGRYILNHDIFNCLQFFLSNRNIELDLTPAISLMLMSEKFYAYKIKKRRFDCGQLNGYKRANRFEDLTQQEVISRIQHFMKKYEVIQ